MKTTKKQAAETYDKFHSILRCFNGGTTEENKRQSAHCYKRLAEVAAIAEEQIKNPSSHLAKDEWLFNSLKELPQKAWSFRVRYQIV